MSTMLDPTSAAALIGVSPATLRGWRFENRGPAYHRLSARCFRYDEADVRQYIAERRIDPTAIQRETAHATRPQ